MSADHSPDAGNMIERVARAIRDAQKGCGTLPRAAKGDADSPWAIGPSLLIARAAITAMRLATEEMLEAGARSPYCNSDPDPVWKAMIDEALR